MTRRVMLTAVLLVPQTAGAKGPDAYVLQLAPALQAAAAQGEPLPGVRPIAQGEAEALTDDPATEEGAFVVFSQGRPESDAEELARRLGAGDAAKGEITGFVARAYLAAQGLDASAPAPDAKPAELGR